MNPCAMVGECSIALILLCAPDQGLSVLQTFLVRHQPTLLFQPAPPHRLLLQRYPCTPTCQHRPPSGRQAPTPHRWRPRHRSTPTCRLLCLQYLTRLLRQSLPAPRRCLALARTATSQSALHRRGRLLRSACRRLQLPRRSPHLQATAQKGRQPLRTPRRTRLRPGQYRRIARRRSRPRRASRRWCRPGSRWRARWRRPLNAAYKACSQHSRLLCSVPRDRSCRQKLGHKSRL